MRGNHIILITGARHEASAAQTQLSSVRQDLEDVSAAQHRAEAAEEQLRGEVAVLEAERAECSAQQTALSDELTLRRQEMAEAGRMEEILRGCLYSFIIIIDKVRSFVY
eukprot:COSAG05_NODE_3463_length_2044_cov_2.765039_1_plen_108_part_10